MNLTLTGFLIPTIIDTLQESHQSTVHYILANHMTLTTIMQHNIQYTQIETQLTCFLIPTIIDTLQESHGGFYFVCV